MIKYDLPKARGTALIISIRISQVSPLEFTCPEMKISPSQISVSSITLDLLVCGSRWARYATLCATAAAGQKVKSNMEMTYQVLPVLVKSSQEL